MSVTAMRGPAVQALVLAAALGLAAPALAQEPVPAAPQPGDASTPQDATAQVPTAEATLDEVLVSGEQPGPGMWRVSKATPDGEHVLWILASYSPLPKKLTWQARQVEAVMAQSTLLLGTPRIDAKIGFFNGLATLPALVGIANNPNGARLADVLPPELYARWLPLKQKYIGNDNDVEKMRPIFAAFKLYASAVEQSGMEFRNIVWPVVEKMAKRRDVEVSSPVLAVKVDKPRDMVKEFKKSEIADLECFSKMIERFESDMSRLRTEANAWATGDVATLRASARTELNNSCASALLNSRVMQQRGLGDITKKVEGTWLDAADRALTGNSSTVAVLPMRDLLRPDGYVTLLRARGYTVEEP
jgi:uncharacterized protein YbaP (TraB family)